MPFIPALENRIINDSNLVRMVVMYSTLSVHFLPALVGSPGTELEFAL